ncbi:MAG TPA: hypothetical protein VFQ77_06995, partial [Pseudonocardiaceae bacterium]|nr:hypothetical protein [Pseudonocardiaceae bacterium]
SGLRLLNPGSPTDRRRQPYCSYLTADLDRGALQDLALVRIGAAPDRAAGDRAARDRPASDRAGD